MFPSFRVRESIKTGLAMVVTIGIALRMEFLEPAWAGFAVAMISLDTAGQSLNKAALRMGGTVVAFVASLTFIGLFPQERWAMLLALTPYIGVITYMMVGGQRLVHPLPLRDPSAIPTRGRAPLVVTSKSVGHLG